MPQSSHRGQHAPTRAGTLTAARTAALALALTLGLALAPSEPAQAHDPSQDRAETRAKPRVEPGPHPVTPPTAAPLPDHAPHGTMAERNAEHDSPTAPEPSWPSSWGDRDEDEQDAIRDAMRNPHEQPTPSARAEEPGPEDLAGMLGSQPGSQPGSQLGKAAQGMGEGHMDLQRMLNAAEPGAGDDWACTYDQRYAFTFHGDAASGWAENAPAPVTWDATRTEHRRLGPEIWTLPEDGAAVIIMRDACDGDRPGAELASIRLERRTYGGDQTWQLELRDGRDRTRDEFHPALTDHAEAMHLIRNHLRAYGDRRANRGGLAMRRRSDGLSRHGVRQRQMQRSANQRPNQQLQRNRWHEWMDRNEHGRPNAAPTRRPMPDDG